MVSCGEGLWGFVKHETKGGLALKSTVSGLGETRKNALIHLENIM